jgi:site-specific DNA-methyltransferase (adenine-specific)
MINLLHGDCLIESDKIESGSVDLILTDLPYGTVKDLGNSDTIQHGMKGKTQWDSVIDTDKIMQIANRILRKNGKMILTAQQPFTNELINKALPNLPFNYSMIWEKDHFANALTAKKAPLNYYEDVLVFSKELCYTSKSPLKKIMGDYSIKYGKDFLIDLIFKEGRYKTVDSAKAITSYKFGFNNGRRFELMDLKMYNYLSKFMDFKETHEELKEIDNQFKKQYPSTFNLWEGNKYKSNILKYKKDYTGHHPTQKPVLLLEDLIKTFSNENDLVVDLTMGSGSTGVACVNTNRNFIGIEKDENYFKIAEERINSKNLFTN